jgi:PAS domain S-box-containing protein
MKGVKGWLKQHKLDLSVLPGVGFALNLTAEQTQALFQEIFEYSRVSTKGLTFFESHQVPEFDSGGSVKTVLGVNHDITERKWAEDEIQRLNRIYAILSEINQTIVRVRDLQELLDEVCRILVETGRFQLAWIGSVDAQTKALEVLAYHGQKNDDVEYLQAALSGQDPGTREPLMAAIREGRLFFSNDIERDKRTLPGYERALEQGYHSFAVLPLEVSGRVWGGVHFYLAEPSFFDGPEIKLLLEVVADLSYAVESIQQEQRRKTAEAELQRSEERYRSLVENLNEVVFTLDLDGKLTYVSPAIEQVSGYSPEEVTGESFVRFVYADDLPGLQTSFTRTLAGQMEPYEFRVISRRGVLRWIRTSSQPQFHDGRLIGVIGILTDITERKKAEGALRRRVDELEAVSRISTTLTSGFDLRVILDALLDQLIAQLGIDAADILLFRPASQGLEYAAGHGFHSRGIERSRLRLGEGYAGRAAFELRTIRVDNLGRRKDFIHSELLASEGFVVYYGVPLVAKGQIQGVLEIFHRSALDPDDEWVRFLETLAKQAAIAIDNAELFEGLQRSNLELALAYDATIEGWSRALDMRDRETEGHTQRVTEMAFRLAGVMGMSQAELVHIRRGGLLHDIGKMAIPDNILLKQGRLSPAEWKIMRQHPVYAYEMLLPIAYLRPALDIPYCHHEKWDGSGYPRGLKGEQIPLAARIFAVVDVWDALRSDRHYRKAWSDRKTQAYIRKQAGKYFDPKVVEAFLGLLQHSAVSGLAHERLVNPGSVISPFYGAVAIPRTQTDAMV